MRTSQERLRAKANRKKKPVKDGERNWKESDFAAKVSSWLIAHGGSTAAFEFKVTTGDSIPFDALRPHQKEALLRAKHGKLYHKISDAGNAYGGQVVQLPFDAFMLVGVKAFVVWMPRIKERGKKDFALIDIDIWDQEEKTSTRKSLTWERSKIVAKICTL